MANENTSSQKSYRGHVSAVNKGWRRRLFVIIFESDTRAGRMFDTVLLLAILISVAVVMLDSVASIHAKWGRPFAVLEWIFTLIFTIEYMLRLVCVRQPLRFVRSGWGIIDIIAIAPTWLALLFPSLHALIDVRVLRLLRIFRLLRLGAYIAEFNEIRAAIYASRRKIATFISFVLVVDIVAGTLMYVVEGPENGFTSVPVSVYWAITTTTTVGFGDITPQTAFGRLISSVMMLMGWGTLAVPTGIVSAEFAARRTSAINQERRRCQACQSIGHSPTARHCCDCGAKLE
jgi:voltage-gated potassium channel